MMKNILITVRAGLIGSDDFKRLKNKHEIYHIYKIDALIYAGNLEKTNEGIF